MPPPANNKRRPVGGVLFYTMQGTGIVRSAVHSISNPNRRDTPPGVSGRYGPILRTPGDGCPYSFCRERPMCRSPFSARAGWERHAGRSLQTKRNRTLSCAVIFHNKLTSQRAIPRMPPTVIATPANETRTSFHPRFRSFRKAPYPSCSFHHASEPGRPPARYTGFINLLSIAVTSI